MVAAYDGGGGSGGGGEGVVSPQKIMRSQTLVRINTRALVFVWWVTYFSAKRGFLPYSSSGSSGGGGGGGGLYASGYPFPFDEAIEGAGSLCG